MRTPHTYLDDLDSEWGGGPARVGKACWGGHPVLLLYSLYNCALRRETNLDVIGVLGDHIAHILNVPYFMVRDRDDCGERRSQSYSILETRPLKPSQEFPDLAVTLHRRVFIEGPDSPAPRFSPPVRRTFEFRHDRYVRTGGPDMLATERQQ